MQSEDYVCSACNERFALASNLLQHFAGHAKESYDFSDKASSNFLKEKCIPDLYPIATLKSKSSSNANEKNEQLDSGLEENLIPLKVCLVTMGNDAKIDENSSNLRRKKKYLCTYCLKSFGWSTDLKRHTLTHTGEKPFHCDICSAKFTRKFILQKHKIKHHHAMLKIPPLKRIAAKKSNVKLFSNKSYAKGF